MVEMPTRGPGLELLQDDDGSVALGWVGEGVFYARYVGALSAQIGAAHRERVQRILCAVSSFRYFSDASDLTQYDLLARSAFTRLVLENRRKFSQLVMLTWSGGISPATAAFAAAVGEPVSILADRVEFERLLIRAAPFALHWLDSKPWSNRPDSGGRRIDQ
jgi:hypothetical protein